MHINILNSENFELGAMEPIGFDTKTFNFLSYNPRDNILCLLIT